VSGSRGKVVSLPRRREVELVHNHHNFAWLEEHGGEELYVIRKGPRGVSGQKDRRRLDGDNAVILQGATPADRRRGAAGPRALLDRAWGGRVIEPHGGRGKATRRASC